MTRVEKRILGTDPSETARRKLLSERRTTIESENPNLNWIGGLPHVIPQDQSVRYHPFTGKLYLVSYHTKLEAPNIIYRRWSQHSSLESATGAAVEVLSKYDKNGDTVSKTQELDRFIREKLQEFGDNTVTDERLEEFQQETGEVLTRLGFKVPRKPSKVKINEQVRAAIGPDSLGRRNPLISRTRLASALLTVLTEYQIQDKTAEKYLHLFISLLGRQQLEEAYVESILEEFSKGNFMPEVLQEAALKQGVKTAPYRVPVMQAYIALADTVPTHRRNEFATYFENDSELLETLDNPDVPLEERRRIITANLQTALEDGESIYNPSV